MSGPVFPILLPSPVPNYIFYPFHLLLYPINRVTQPSVHLCVPAYSLACRSKIQPFSFVFNNDNEKSLCWFQEAVEEQLLCHFQAHLACCVRPPFLEAHGAQVWAGSLCSLWWNNRHLYFYISHRWLRLATWEVVLKTNESHNARWVPKYYGNITTWHGVTDCKIQRGQMGGTVGNRIQWEL